MLSSITNIELFLSTRPREYEKFLEDRCFRSAVQWEIAIIGEAMNKLLLSLIHISEPTRPY